MPQALLVPNVTVASTHETVVPDRLPMCNATSFVPLNAYSRVSPVIFIFVLELRLDGVHTICVILCLVRRPSTNDRLQEAKITETEPIEVIIRLLNSILHGFDMLLTETPASRLRPAAESG